MFVVPGLQRGFLTFSDFCKEFVDNSNKIYSQSDSVHRGIAQKTIIVESTFKEFKNAVVGLYAFHACKLQTSALLPGRGKMWGLDVKSRWMMYENSNGGAVI